jgi:NAD(P)H-flavin reductase/ferredoxin
MLLHLLRHFAFDRFRGFRAFSWLTGVALIGFVYASGINGYMLPWDQMSQFVITACFEWFDSLPVFDGTLMRNFIYPSSVNDRLFSLLAFMHIGIALLLLLLMWVHVQRVPKARTSPSRPIMASLALTLLALSLLEPALSQGGPANMAVAVGTLRFDWFYLALLPLLYKWPLGWVWTIVGAASALLTALPWLSGRVQRGQRNDFKLEVHSGTGMQSLTLRADETLLEAGLRHGVALPYECRNGGCGVCRCTVLEGRVNHGLFQPTALLDAARAQGQALMCCAVALSDLVIEVECASAVPVPQHHLGRVERIDRLTPEMIRLELSLPGGPIRFTAGQYINIVLDDGQRRSFSFANPPHRNDHVELHVRLIPGGRFTTHVFTRLQVGDELVFEGPLGDFTLRDSARPILFVAGATGFAPVKSIIEDAFHRGVERPMWLYWGVRERRDLYLLDLAERWQREYRNFHLVPVLSHAQPEDTWTGRTGLVHEAILADFPDLGGHEVYVCGSVKMVDAAVPAFIAQGLAEDVCFSDAFVPSARRANWTLYPE